MIARRKTRQIAVGNILIGGDAPISIQSMTTTDTQDVAKTVAQIKKLEKAGCEIVRVAVRDMEAVEAIPEIKRQMSIPLVADIHFNYHLALASIENGVDKIRINPGNIGGAKRFQDVVRKAKEHKTPMRLGVNAGSLDQQYKKKPSKVEENLVASAIEFIKLAEDLDYDKLVISVKSSSVPTTIKAYEVLANVVDYPFHIGITEAGTLISGTVKSALGLGILLNQGIGDTIRVSLTADPVEEVMVGYKILSALGLRMRGVDVISCPTCSRCEIDIIPLVEEVERSLSKYVQPIKVAVMGCEVNGPGEAREADIGIAVGRKEGLLFKKGEVVGKLPPEMWVETLVEEAEKMIAETEQGRSVS